MASAPAPVAPMPDADDPGHAAEPDAAGGAAGADDPAADGPDDHDPDRPAEAPRPGGSLKKAALRGSAIVLGGRFAQQFVRFGGNVAMSWVLSHRMAGGEEQAKAAFGVMLLVNSVIQLLGLFADIGVGAAVVQHERGDERRFLNTAWTMQVVRGVGLYLVASALAWPLSRFYDMPELAVLIPVAALTAILNGLVSGRLLTARRHMHMGRLTAVELSAQVFAVVVMIAWAFVHPSVWALVGGAVMGAAAKLVASHMIPGEPDRPAWDRSAVKELVHFGKWVFMSTAVFGLSSNADRFMLGKFIDAETLGVYGFGIMMSLVIPDVIIGLNNRIAYPSLSRIYREERHRMREVFYRIRLPLDCCSMIPIGAVAVSGTWIVGLLYPDGFILAGWVLQVLSIRAAMTCSLMTAESFLFAMGKPQYAFMRNVLRSIWILAAIPTAFVLAGDDPDLGLRYAVWGLAMSELPMGVLLWVALYRHRGLSLLHELRAPALFGVGAGLGYLITLIPLPGG